MQLFSHIILQESIVAQYLRPVSPIFVTTQNAKKIPRFTRALFFALPFLLPLFG